MKPPTLSEIRFLLAGTRCGILMHAYGYTLTRDGKPVRRYKNSTALLSCKDLADAMVLAVETQEDVRHKRRMMDVAAYVQTRAKHNT